MEPETTNRESNAGRKRPRSESHRPEHVYPRKRAITACRLCRHRKVKCNNQRPICGACADANASCVYEDADDHSVFDPASLKILERLDQVLSRLDQMPSASQASALTPAVPASINGFNGPASTQQTPQSAPRGHESTDDEAWIPAARTTIESVLAWPVFSDVAHPTLMLDAVYGAEREDAADFSAAKLASAKAKPAGVVEEDIPRLVQRFVEFVHLKNPVVDVDTLWAYTHQIVEDGVDWSPASCLVLLACALGSVAKYYQSGQENGHSGSSSITSEADELASGAAYYNLARRRFGLLEKGILAPQCHFLAGVYLMYTMKPIQAWSKMQQACQAFHIYLMCQSRSNVPEMNEHFQSKRRLLEQRIYWSCYKAECEHRAEFDLPSGPLATSGYPNMHPSTPDFLLRNPASAENSPEFVESPESVASRRVQDSRVYLEASWYYYLTEITLRRMENQILRMFYQNYHHDWLDHNIPSMLDAATHIEHQLDLCLEQLPASLRRPEHQELFKMVEGRIFECKIWLYRPFLYYSIHSPVYSANWSAAQPFTDRAIATCFTGIGQGTSKHRHHGTFFALRCPVTLAFCVIAAARCEHMIGRLEHNWKEQIQAFIQRIRYWQDECPGVTEAITMLEEQLV